MPENAPLVRRRGGGGRRREAAIAGLMLCMAALLPARTPADELAVEHFESLRPKMSAPVAGARRLELAAFGHEYRFDLRANPRLISAAAGAGVELLAGRIEGLPGSWARMSVRDGIVRGMFWDGRELFVVEAPPGAAKSGGDTVLFRLADATPPQGLSFAGDVRPAPRDAAAAYGALVDELRAARALAAASALARLDLSVLGDAAFRARYGSDDEAREAILTRMNNVDGIFTAQVGVELNVASVNIADAVTAPLPATSDASMLLEQLGLLRQRNATLNARGLTHLFTGNQFTGNTVGIAYSDGLCSRRFAASIASGHSSAALDALIAAHEIGHVFGAPHDGDQECAATPQGQFIMSPSLTGGVTSFSQCSLDAMQVAVDSASCLAAAAPDLALPQNLGGESAATGSDFTWVIRIANEGGGAAVGGRATVQVAPQLTLVAGGTSGGGCAVQGTSLSCNLPTIAAQASENLTVTVRGATGGAFAIQAEVTVAEDSNAANNSGAGTLSVSSPGSAPAPAPPASEGGGGGAFDSWTLLALLAAWVARMRRMLSPRAARGTMDHAPASAIPR